jgi:hypothetical protein
MVLALMVLGQVRTQLLVLTLVRVVAELTLELDLRTSTTCVDFSVKAGLNIAHCYLRMLCV